MPLTCQVKESVLGFHVKLVSHAHITPFAPNVKIVYKNG